MLGLSTSTMDKSSIIPSRKACRSLFGPVDHTEVKKTLAQEMDKFDRQASERWNFDFKSGTPLAGKLTWTLITPANQDRIPPIYSQMLGHLEPRRLDTSLHSDEEEVEVLGAMVESPAACSPVTVTTLPAETQTSAPCSPVTSAPTSSLLLPPQSTTTVRPFVSQSSTIPCESTLTSPSRKRKRQSQMTGEFFSYFSQVLNLSNQAKSSRLILITIYSVKLLNSLGNINNLVHDNLKIKPINMDLILIMIKEMHTELNCKLHRFS